MIVLADMVKADDRAGSHPGSKNSGMEFLRNQGKSAQFISLTLAPAHGPSKIAHRFIAGILRRLCGLEFVKALKDDALARSTDLRVIGPNIACRLVCDFDRQGKHISCLC
jgi:hypothetical protein